MTEPELSSSLRPKLDELGLNPQNSIVIGSGILEALGIRKSRDIDLVVAAQDYQRLESRPELKSSSIHDCPILVGDLLEIGRSWPVLGGDRDLGDLSRQSVVINGVRYVSLDFLLAVKESWVVDGGSRPKDLVDIELIKSYQRGRNGQS